ATACRVDDAHGWLDKLKLLRSDQTHGLSRLGSMYGDKVRLAEQLLETHETYAELSRAGGLYVRVEGDQTRAEGRHSLGKQDADASEPDDANGLPGDLDTRIFRPLPLPRLERR